MFTLRSINASGQHQTGRETAQTLTNSQRLRGEPDLNFESKLRLSESETGRIYCLVVAEVQGGINFFPGCSTHLFISNKMKCNSAFTAGFIIELRPVAATTQRDHRKGHISWERPFPPVMHLSHLTFLHRKVLKTAIICLKYVRSDSRPLLSKKHEGRTYSTAGQHTVP